MGGGDTPGQSGVSARQFLAMLRLSLKRHMRSRVFWGALIFAGFPLPLLLIQMLAMLFFSGFSFADPLTLRPLSESPGAAQEIVRSAHMIDEFHVLLLTAYFNFGLVFAAILFGTAAAREDLDDQTLHYLHLQPIPRWMIVAGKFAAYLLIAAPLFLVSILLAQFLILLPFGSSGFQTVLFEQGQLAQTVAACATAFLALAVYGAFFLAFCHLFKGMLGVLVFYGWEAAANFVPETLRQFSLSYYFQGLLPQASMQETGPIAFLVQGPTDWRIAVVLTAVLALSLALSFWFAARRECLYGQT